ncbi:lysophospholipid acyltransferase 5-like [Centruroides vittatus]|uniref:lysophospholipid acyltransferase 5-like n=1 Tax=Centruroides vittatus TaxID=120091 RepID=UPI00350F8446
MLDYFAEWLGASEPALRLLFSILLGFPLALVHRCYVINLSPSMQHVYFTFCGISLGYFNYGWDVTHSLVCVLVIYLVLLFAGGTLHSVIFSFVFLMGYLLIGYYCTATSDYDIKWSLPHCVLTLRLIGLAFDVFDGCKDPDKLPPDQKKTALRCRPSVLQISGFTYFFGGFLVGPQFSMRRYLDFVEGKFDEKILNGNPSCVRAALRRLALGMVVLSVYQIGNLYVPERFLLSEYYESMPFWKRLLGVGVWGKICLSKYVACWLISEGSAILSGLTYAGVDDNGRDRWDGCANVDLWGYETTTTFDGIIKSFNINTNLWAAQYVFKRLRFLGNKLLSQFLTLLFLAVWHGLHSGYYVCFLNEFIVMKMERDVIKMINENATSKAIVNNSALKILLLVFNKVYVTVMFGYCIVPFVLLSVERWWKAYASVYFIGHVIYLGWPLVQLLFRMVISRTEKKE